MILYHHNIENLKYLIKSIDFELNDIYLHIDKKSKEDDITYIKSFTKCSKLIIIERYNIFWGGYSSVEGILRLLKQSYQSENYSYFHLLSGEDMPLLSPKETYNFFESNYPKEFIAFDSLDKMDNKYLNRVRYYFINDYINNRKIVIRSYQILIFLQKLFGIQKKINKNDFQKGSNWFSLTKNSVGYILDNESWIKENFSNGFCVDEMAFHSLLFSSKYFRNVYSDDEKSNLRYIDWNRGSPYQFDESDFDELFNLNGKFIFVRKVNQKLAQQIFKEISNQQSTID